MKGLPSAHRPTENSRARIVTLLRRGFRTVEELAHSLAITDNAVRSQLSALERDGVVRTEGVRRGEGAGKPAVLYGINPDAEAHFSTAYAPVLATVLESLIEEFPRGLADDFLRGVGRRLAQDSGGAARGSLHERTRAAGAILTALGAEVDVGVENGVAKIRGYGCPLSVAVARRPEACEAIRSMVAEVTGAPVRQCCEHGLRPKCRFEVRESA
jgi:predicted ArsR family transcriptional regulator